MPTTPRPGLPFVYVTWLTKLLAGDDACVWASWFRSHFKFDKVERGFDLAAWKGMHTEMVTARRAELEADGWMVTVEDQNHFRLKGASALLSGKPDLVATKGQDVLVVDCKSGQPRDADFFQVLVYLFALPLVWAQHYPERFTAGPLRWCGEVAYRTHRRTIAAEECSRDQVARITTLVRTLGADTPPPRVPSARECGFCDVSKHDCPARVDTEAEPVLVSEF
jgi:hypothetical protein